MWEQNWVMQHDAHVLHLTQHVVPTLHPLFITCCTSFTITAPVLLNKLQWCQQVASMFHNMLYSLFSHVAPVRQVSSDAFTGCTGVRVCNMLHQATTTPEEMHANISAWFPQRWLLWFTMDECSPNEFFTELQAQQRKNLLLNQQKPRISARSH